jgi:uncharacterized protein (UPF0332 family)
VKPENIRSLVVYRMEQARASMRDSQMLIDGEGSAIGVVNRAYYAMFYSTLALLQTLGKTPSKHTGVLSLFDQEFVLKGFFPRHMGRTLHEAFDLRQEWDYQTLSPPQMDKAVQIQKKAEEFVQAVEKFLDEQSRL